MIQRLLNPTINNSYFLFGPRGSGKTTFLENIFKTSETCFWINLLLPEIEEKYSLHPGELLDEIKGRERLEWVIIDEIQKVPKLLDVVHQAIEKNKIKFVLTGSSARKIKRSSSNLLAGRAYVYNLFPFCSSELGSVFDLEKALNWGTLPKISSIHDSDEKKLFLQSYALTYLKEEVWFEQLIRNIDPFRKFLEVSAQCNGEPLNYSNIARDVGVEYKTVQFYYEILEDTLLGFALEPFDKSLRKRQGKSKKFYYFDTGVKRAFEKMLSVPVAPKTVEYGKAFEHFLITEFVKLNSYYNRDFDFLYLRTQDRVEIDLIIKRPGKPYAFIEIKSTEHVQENHVSRLNHFLKDFKNAEGFCLSCDLSAKIIGKTSCLYWKDGLQKIFSRV
ncbi:MAG: hypothetical protein A2583_08080 [Bdellovibrionales bacterium RIFOXYD1_FULL_53_11]|nr:MAG: hypothetical protein A2583_08080 [Bdellovibrionales bacterium RIFOXYD1_FULL_53_11]